LEALILAVRSALADPRGLERRVGSLSRLLEWRLDLDRNVNPDLIIEKALAFLRRGSA
jgi:hypothetical protein